MIKLNAKEEMKMEKIYEAPELEVVYVLLTADVLSNSPTEATIGEHIDPGDDDDPINLDF